MKYLAHILILTISFSCWEASSKSTAKHRTLKASKKYQLASRQTQRQKRNKSKMRRKKKTESYTRHLGFHSGMNFGYAQTGTSNDGATRNALVLGVTLEQRLFGFLFAQPELAIVQRGVKTDVVELGNVGLNGDIQLDYLELSMFLKVKSNLGSPRVRLFFLAGPSFAITIKREVDVLGLVSIELRDRFQSIDLTATIGTGLEFAISKTTAITTNLRHTIGLMDIDKEGTKFYTRGIQLLVGLSFALK